MSNQVSQSAGGDAKKHDKPVAGLHITRSSSSDAVAGAILRGQQAGHNVLVLSSAPDGHEAIRFADRLDAKVIKTNAVAQSGTEVEEALRETARGEGYPGVLWQSDPKSVVDFEASVQKLQESTSYIETIEPRPAVDQEPHVLAGIPAYNEAETIGALVSEVSKYVDEILIVDDGSDDDTATIAREAGATVIEHEDNQGYGAALKTIFSAAARSGTDHLVILDGDGQHDPADIPRLVDTQEKTDAEVVIGSRLQDESDTDLPLYRRVGLGVVNVMTNLSLGALPGRSRVQDTQSGFRAYSRPAIKSLASEAALGDRMEASTDILQHAHEQNYSIKEVGVDIRYDVQNASHHSPIHHGVMLVMNLLRIIETKRPVTVLGIPGFVSVFVGIGFAYWTLANFLSSNVFPIGLAIASVFFTLAGIFAGFTAIILHSLNTHLTQNGGSR